MVKLLNEDLKLLALFEQMTGAHAEDVLASEAGFVFVVEQGHVGKAIGKGGSTLERVRKALNKTVLVVESSDDVRVFARNCVSPVPVKDLNVVEDNSGRFVSLKVAPEQRGYAIGRGGERIKLLSSLLQRRFGYELKVM